MRALFVGGTAGLGYELADYAARVSGVSAVVLGRTAAKVKCLPSSVRAISMDLCNRQSIDKTLRDIPGHFQFVVWVAGRFLRKPFWQTSATDIDVMIDTHLTGPIYLLQKIHARAVRAHARGRNAAYHLTVISSLASWKCRRDQVLYSMVKSAQAHFARSLVPELVRDVPGSRVALVNPGGIRTPTFWRGTDEEIGKFLDPHWLAHVIWDRTVAQSAPFDEYHVIRTSRGRGRILEGQRTPASPNLRSV